MKKRFRYNPDTDEVEEVGQPAARGQRDWKPLVCESLALDGWTSDEARQLDAKLGAPDVDYDKETNAPIFHDKATYDKYLKAHGYHNKSSCAKHAHFTPAQFEAAKKRVLEHFDKIAVDEGIDAL